jgi:adenosylhomocysteine nucleosidase
LKAEARLASGLGHVVAGGGTREGATGAIFPHCAALLSFGLAGGLDPALKPGALVIPRCVLVDGEAVACDPALLAWLGGPTVEAIIDAPGVVATTDHKAEMFAASGAAAVDLESGEIARRGLPFAVLRAICDPATLALPHAALVGLTASGGISLGRVMASLLRDPGQMGTLLRLASHTAVARRSLKRAVAALKNG